MSNDLYLELNDVTESHDTVNEFRKPKIEVCGEVEMEDNFGNTTFTRNKLLIHGSTMALRKLFNVNLKYKFKTLNQTLDLYQDVAAPALPDGFKGPHLEDAVLLFGVGTGGSGSGFESVKQVKYNEVDISDVIPFRYTDEPLSEADASKYKLAKTEGTYTAYYGKRFEATPVIKCLAEDGTEVPDNVEILESDNITSFIELKLKITKDDCREWFAIKGGGVESARINTLSLLMGIPVEVSPGVIDYINVKVFTKYNMKNEALEEGKEIYITYRIYI